MNLATARLELVPATVELIEAELAGREAFAAALDARVPVSWPPEFHDRPTAEFILEKLREGSEEAGSWWLYYVVLQANDPGTLVGTCGYKGPPGGSDFVEIGYSILADYRRQGYATEAARALVARAFSLGEVTRVVAETLPHLTPSIGVLRKINFSLAGAGSEEGVIRYELRSGEYRLDLTNDENRTS